MKKAQIFTLLAILITTPNLLGQYISENGWFEVDVINDCDGGCSGTTVRGCEGLQIIIRTTASAPCDCFSTCNPSCDFDYLGDNSFPALPNPLQFTYEEAGSYRLQVLFPQPDGPDFINIQINEKFAPDFDIFSCSSRSIQVNIQDNQYDNYIINFGDGSPEEIVPLGSPDVEHNYTSTTPRTVTVRGLDNNTADNCARTADALTPLETIPASSFDSLVSLDAGTLALYYDLQPDIRHRLEIKVNDGAYTTFNALLDDTTIADTIQNLDLENNSYCFRIRSIDPCLGFNSIVATSPEICNVLLDAAFEDNVNALNWSIGTAASSFDLNRVSDNQELLRPGLTGNAFNDTDIDCDIEYCYTLFANLPDGSVSRSLERCGNSFRTIPPQAVNDLSVSVEDANIQLDWPLSTTEEIASYQLLRGTNPAGLGNIAAVEMGTSFTDTGLNPQETSYCYRIDPTDECGNTNTTGTIACSMLLGGSIAADNTVNLSWNEYLGWQQGVSNYTIEKSYLNGDAPDQASTSASFEEVDNNNDQQVILYRVRANPVDNTLAPAYSNTLMLVKPNNIYYPNAFTPDGNGLNETFTVMGRFIEQYELRIFNRWGEEIFFSGMPETPWDGTLNGRSLPYGTYAFRLDIVDQAGREITETGTIVLLRR